ncbi:histidine--tRNA ligase [bacterium]|nr:histidine--tRNA ligase [bacterium]
MAKKTINSERPGGFKDFLPAEYLAREEMMNKLEKVFRLFGFNPIETPKVEFLKTLSGEESDTGKNIFHIKGKDDNEVLALPFDHTVPLARILASNPYNPKSKTGIKLPWKRMVKGVVFRGETPQSGRYRQFYQMDADIAGTSSMLADAEIINLMYKSLKELGLKNFIIKINNRKILNGLTKLIKIKSGEKDNTTKEIFRILDKLDKIGIEKVLKELKSSSVGLSSKGALKIKEYINLKGDNKNLLKECKKIFKDIKIAEEGIGELEEILNYLKEMKVPENNIQIDFSIARGLDYYTGPVMETSLLDAPEFGSIFSGGRYNNLVSRFTGKELPAVGASIGVDRLFTALEQLNIIKKDKNTVTETMILRLMPDKNKEYIKIANELRELGLNTEISFLEDTTFKSQFNYALNQGVKYVIIYGEEEFKKSVVQIKNLETRKQEEIKIKNLGNYFK